MPKSSYRMGLVVNSWAVSKVTYDLEPVRERNQSMDAFAKHIHGNQAFSLENVAKAVEAAMAKKEPQR